MIKLEPYSKIWYDNLAEGKIKAVRCKRCGSIKFPPMPICGECSGTEMEWIDMDTEVSIESVNFSSTGNPPYQTGAWLGATVKVAGGDTFVTRLDGEEATMERAWELVDELPIKGHMEITTYENGISFPVVKADRQ